MAPPTKPKRQSRHSLDIEERKGLLTGKNEQPEDDIESDKGAWSRRRIIIVASVLILLLLSAALLQHVVIQYHPSSNNNKDHPNLSFNGDYTRSNGTHDFRRTVLMVSIDGLRADYLDRGFTPHLLGIAKQGIRAKSMIPIFPTLTFPNHWALLTGLYAEHHGIVANDFWDPKTKAEFHYNRNDIAYQPGWWLGEPIWETAGKAGVKTANLMWPGPPETTSGAKPTYFVPWRDHVPMSDKLEQVMQWIDLPLEERPQLILAYEPSLDQAGHATGPMSSRVNATLVKVDEFAKDLHTELVNRNLTDIVDIIFVSDHGMTDTSHPTLIYIDDILTASGMAQTEHEDGWPSMGLRFKFGTNESFYYERLVEGSQTGEYAGMFDVFTPETMPKRWHFSEHERIAPIYVVPKIGYVLTTRKEGDTGMSKGNHGYDNTNPSMHAMFVAHGPFSAVLKALHQPQSSRSLVSRFLDRPNKGWHSTSLNTYVMNSFPNIEIYNLAVKLLGIGEWKAKTDGTEGFWDMYL